MKQLIIILAIAGLAGCGDKENNALTMRVEMGSNYRLFERSVDSLNEEYCDAYSFKATNFYGFEKGIGRFVNEKLGIVVFMQGGGKKELDSNHASLRGKLVGRYGKPEEYDNTEVWEGDDLYFALENRKVWGHQRVSYIVSEFDIKKIDSVMSSMPICYKDTMAIFNIPYKSKREDIVKYMDKTNLKRMKYGVDSEVYAFTGYKGLPKGEVWFSIDENDGLSFALVQFDEDMFGTTRTEEFIVEALNKRFGKHYEKDGGVYRWRVEKGVASNELELRKQRSDLTLHIGSMRW